jgi:hypothetical protein
VAVRCEGPEGVVVVGDDGEAPGLVVAVEDALGPGAGGMRLVPDRVEGMGVEVLTPEHRRIMEIVASSDVR